MCKAVISTKIISQLQSSIIQTNATRLGVPADIVCSSLANVGTNNILIQGHAIIGR